MTTYRIERPPEVPPTLLLAIEHQDGDRREHLIKVRLRTEAYVMLTPQEAYRAGHSLLHAAKDFGIEDAA